MNTIKKALSRIGIIEGKTRKARLIKNIKDKNNCFDEVNDTLCKARIIYEAGVVDSNSPFSSSESFTERSINSQDFEKLAAKLNDIETELQYQ